MPSFYTTREVAELLHQPLWKVQRVFEHGDVREPPRFAGRRAVPREMLPDVIDALRNRGWLPVENTAKAHT